MRLIHYLPETKAVPHHVKSSEFPAKYDGPFVRTILLTTAALVGFSANSLLTRAALGAGLIDAPSFTLIRLVTGAVTLAILVRRFITRSAQRTDRPQHDGRGSWIAAVALAGYAVAFTVAYTRIGAAVGALLLFGAVQITMTGTGLVRGERPRRVDWIGVGLAMAGLAVLTLPGATAPNLVGAVLMLAAGACWGVYSLLGRTSRDPLRTTAGNFVRASLLAFVALAAALPAASLSWRGALLATASGSLASGVGYTFWYAALPALAAWRAALLQLLVPILTALLAIVWLGEAISPRLLLATAFVTTGIGLTIHRTSRR
jgi:drug/metabolite transporter (DMT)-like permease